MYIKLYNEFILEYVGNKNINFGFNYGDIYTQLLDPTVDYEQRREDMVNTVQKTFTLLHKDRYFTGFTPVLKLSKKVKNELKDISTGIRRYLGYMKNIDKNGIFGGTQIKKMLDYDGDCWGHIAANNYFENQEILDEINSWDICSKSPWSHSYYDNTEIDFGYKPEGTHRIAEHWNFISKGNLECETYEEVIDDHKFRLGKFENGKYRIIKIYNEL